MEGVLAQMEGANGSAGTNQARLMMITLKPLSVRKSTPDQIIRRLRPKLARIPGVNAFVTNPPAIRLGARMARSAYQYTMQGLDLAQLQDYSDQLMDELRSQPGFVDVNSDMDAAMPSVQVKIDRDRAAAFGVSPQQIETALGSAFGGQQISQINTSSNQYEVIMELLPRYQRDASALDRLYITGAGNGTLVPLTAVTKMTASTVPLSVNHAGQIPAVTISFDLGPGKALSDAVTGIRQASEDIGMPDSIQGNFQGTAAAFEESTKNMGGLLLIAMVVVYIILGILYESFIHPLTILSGLPSAAVGGLLTLWFAHLLFLAGITSSGHVADALCLCRHDHADRHRQEERHHDDRLRAEPSAQRQQRHARTGDLRSRGDALPSHHDDHHGGADGHPAHRLRHRRRRGIAPPAGPVRGGRAAAVAASDPLHHAGDLFLSRPLQHPDAAPQGPPPRRGADAGRVRREPISS